MQPPRKLYIGAAVPAQGGDADSFHVAPHHLVTHGVVLGMTGSGKTGLPMVMVEEALRSNAPCILIDVKGDLPNLLLAFPSFAAQDFAPWIDGHAAPDAAVTEPRPRSSRRNGRNSSPAGSSAPPTSKPFARGPTFACSPRLDRP